MSLSSTALNIQTSSIESLELNDTTESISIQAPAASYSLTLPVDNGLPGQTISTDGNGVLSWINSTANVNGTTGRITSSGGSDPIINIDPTYIGQNTITTLGTISTGTWNGGVIDGQYGGTGVNNSTRTITIGGNFSTSGALSFGSAATANQLFYTSSANTLTGLATANRSILTTDGSGVPSFTVGILTSGVIRTTNTTVSTSTNTGSMLNAGGLGNSGRIFTTDLTTVNPIVGLAIFCSCFRTSSLSIPNNTFTNLFNGGTGTISATSPSSMNITTSGVLTVSLAGVYTITIRNVFGTNITGDRKVRATISPAWNGLTSILWPNVIGSCNEIGDSITINITSVPTTITPRVFQDSGAPLNSLEGVLTATKIIS